MKEKSEYYRFTGPARLDKTVSSLKGIIAGITADNVVNEQEIRALNDWLAQNSEFENRHPFNEFIPIIRAALSDGVLTDEEIKNIGWLAEKLTGTDYYKQASAEIQQLHGIVGGIASDGVITKPELESLSVWMDERSHLKTIWPFAEIESIATDILQDGVITAEEHRRLMAFLSEFTDCPNAEKITGFSAPVSGICALCPEIIFKQREFCFTGKSAKGPRNTFATAIVSRGGIFSDMLRKTVHYLIVGADSNPCWSYACYGRKIEKAMDMRRQGSEVMIVHENDFWDTIADSRGVENH